MGDPCDHRVPFEAHVDVGVGHVFEIGAVCVACGDGWMVAHLLGDVVEFGMGDLECLTEERVERLLCTVVGGLVLSGAEGCDLRDSEY